MTGLSADICLKHMFSLLEQGGQIALKLMDSSGAELKSDLSVITKTDLAISRLATEILAPFLGMPGHVLVDEEAPGSGDCLSDSFLDSHPFIWALDPIDATRAYANRMPHYGISIGLIRERRPWLGAVYFPSLRELFYCDGEEAYFVKEAFTPFEVRSLIRPWDEVISSRSVFIATDEVLSHFDWRSEDCRVMIFAAAVCEFCWPSIGRGCGALTKVHLWDMAGAWPIFERAGLKMFDIKSGAPLDRLDLSLFEKGKNFWKFKEYHILSTPRNYPLLKEKLSFRKPG